MPDTVAKEKKRVEWIDYFKGIGIILVLIGHWVPKNTLRKLIYAFHMPLFFFASGLTLKLDGDFGFCEYARKKFKSLIVPYIVINISMIPFAFFFRKCVWSSADTLGYNLVGIIYANSDSVFPLLCGPSWFIPTLFLVEMLMYVLRRLLKSKELILAVSFAFAAMGYALSICVKEIRPWHINSVPVAVLYMAIGYYFACVYKEDSWSKIQEKAKWGWGIVLLFVGLFAAYNNGAVSFGGNKYKDIELTLIASFSLIFACVFFCMKIKNWKVLKYIGSVSMIWLAFHRNIIMALQALFPNYTTHNRQLFIGGIVLMATMLILGYIIDKLFPFIVGRKPKNMIQKIMMCIYIIAIICSCVLWVYKDGKFY